MLAQNRVARSRFVLSRAALVAAIALTLAACSSGAASDDASSLTITGASSDAATAVELHEVVDDVMRPVEGGFTVPAGGSLMLAPGGYHLMFMGIPAPIAAGDDVNVTFTLSDGSELALTAVAKDFAGGNEDYDDGIDTQMESPSPEASA